MQSGDEAARPSANNDKVGFDHEFESEWRGLVVIS
jgi:hypothetical protein